MMQLLKDENLKDASHFCVTEKTFLVSIESKSCATLTVQMRQGMVLTVPSGVS